MLNRCAAVKNDKQDPAFACYCFYFIMNLLKIKITIHFSRGNARRM